MVHGTDHLSAAVAAGEIPVQCVGHCTVLIFNTQHFTDIQYLFMLLIKIKAFSCYTIMFGI